MKKMVGVLLALIALLMATGTAMACGVQNPEDCPRAHENANCDADNCPRHEGSADCPCPYYQENGANSEDSDTSTGSDAGTSDSGTTMSMGLIAGAVGLPAVLGYAYSRRR
ncbi:MAG: hypothetical protein R6U44_06485 [Archaeoglobaceae archaeon]